VVSGVLFLLIALNYHTFRNYKNQMLLQIEGIQEMKKQVRAEVDELETLSVPELEGICENMCAYLSGKLESQTLRDKLALINQAYERLYAHSESKHIQDELLLSINKKVLGIAQKHKELKETQMAYEKLRKEKPYSFIASMLDFGPVSLPWEVQVNQAA
jgi:hypothetical protein